MKRQLQVPTRKLTIIAQDPSVRSSAKGKIIRSRIDVPAEILAPGPCGYRVHVIDFDASTGALYKPAKIGWEKDPYENADDDVLLSDPGFHAQNAYAIVMHTLSRFEFALGRRISWGFYGHQIKVAPHAFAEANAFYSEEDQALMFGYIPRRKSPIFTCLSHDVVAHETAHALIDGLRERYTDPSSPAQAAFHEGLADVIALLSVFSMKNVVCSLIDHGLPLRKHAVIDPAAISASWLRQSILFGLAEEMGQELSNLRGNALRQSAKLEPSRKYITDPEFSEPHRLGEILVAAMMNAFLKVWRQRVKALGEVTSGGLDRMRVAEEGSDTAEYLLTMSIRALDYAPPVDLRFGDFLSALLTADREIRPDDSRYQFRETLLNSFESYGIPPCSKGYPGQKGIWDSPSRGLTYDRTHFEAMQREPDEVFRFIWENRKQLCLIENAYTRVLSVRPCVRVAPDGFTLRETVAEYMQTITIPASELKSFHIRMPKKMPLDTEVTLYGGGSLIFDEYGLLKFHIHNQILNGKRQAERLEYLWNSGFYSKGSSLYRRFSHIHRVRGTTLYAASHPPEDYYAD